jgi:hypothetical protein
MRIFLDANVLFTAAHNPKGKAALIIELGQSGIWRLATSAYAAEEARRNISRKFPACTERLDAILQNIVLVADDQDIPCPAGLAEKDRPIFRAARAWRSGASSSSAPSSSIIRPDISLSSRPSRSLSLRAPRVPAKTATMAASGST